MQSYSQQHYTTPPSQCVPAAGPCATQLVLESFRATSKSQQQRNYYNLAGASPRVGIMASLPSPTQSFRKVQKPRVAKEWKRTSSQGLTSSVDKKFKKALKEPGAPNLHHSVRPNLNVKRKKLETGNAQADPSQSTTSTPQKARSESQPTKPGKTGQNKFPGHYPRPV